MQATWRSFRRDRFSAVRRSSWSRAGWSRATARPARAAVDEAVNSVAGEHGGELPAATRERLVTSALGEVVGLGLIDRLWSDRTVRAILVNGLSSVFVDRDGTLQGNGPVIAIGRAHSVSSRVARSNLRASARDPCCGL